MSRDRGESRCRSNCGRKRAVDGRQGSIHGRSSTGVNLSTSGRRSQEAAKADPGGLGREGAGEHEDDGGACTGRGEAVSAGKKLVTISAFDTRRALWPGNLNDFSAEAEPRDYKSSTTSWDTSMFSVYSTISSLFQGYKAHDGKK